MAETFIPKFASAITLSPSGSAAGTAENLRLGRECPQIRLNWKATSAGDKCYVIWTKTTLTDATSSHMAILDGATEAFTKQDADTISVIGTGVLNVICGTGN